MAATSKKRAVIHRTTFDAANGGSFQADEGWFAEMWRTLVMVLSRLVAERKKEVAVDETRKLTISPEERQLITKLYGPDPRESKASSGATDEHQQDSAFVFDLEDLPFVSLEDDSAEWRRH